MDARYAVLWAGLLVGLSVSTGTVGVVVDGPPLPPPPADGIRLGWVSDAQTTGDREPFREAIARFRASGVAAILYGGDTSYGVADAPKDWVEALGPYGNGSRTLFVYGNHDAGPGYASYMPEEGNATWWAARVDRAVVVGLDTNKVLHPDSPQFEWLESTLARHEDDLVILMMHMPWWVPNVYHQDSPWFQGDAEAMDGLVARYDVDLVLAGHEHYHARMERSNVTYVLSGPVDAQVRDVPPQVAQASAFSAAERVSMILDVSTGGVDGYVVDASGDVVDEFRVEEPMPEPGAPGSDGERLLFEGGEEGFGADDILEMNVAWLPFAAGLAAGALFILVIPRLPAMPASKGSKLR